MLHHKSKGKENIELVRNLKLKLYHVCSLLPSVFFRFRTSQTWCQFGLHLAPHWKSL